MLLVKNIDIIIPTYNESENIENMINALEEVFSNNSIDGKIIVVDDNSPDKTGEIAKNMMGIYGNIKVVIRNNNRGLSPSVVEGFFHCESDIICVIDCDFSHPPELIPVFCEKISNGCDIVFGTRYAAGGTITGWSIKRKIISGGATFLAKVVVSCSSDPVSGFFAIRRDVVEGVPLFPRGYKIGLEILGKGNWTKYCEVSYEFRDRENGQSKLGIREILEYLIQIFDIICYKIGTRLKK